jgi:hypothetical protein
MRWWKWIGLAGLVGVTAVGVGVAVGHRRRREIAEVSPDELRDRLHARLRAAESRSVTAS